MKSEDRDRRVLALYERVLEIEQRLIPTGLHTFGKPGNTAEISHLLTMVASFERPELGVPALDGPHCPRAGVAFVCPIAPGKRDLRETDDGTRSR